MSSALIKDHNKRASTYDGEEAVNTCFIACFII